MSKALSQHKSQHRIATYDDDFFYIASDKLAEFMAAINRDQFVAIGDSVIACKSIKKITKVVEKPTYDSSKETYDRYVKPYQNGRKGLSKEFLEQCKQDIQKRLSK